MNVHELILTAASPDAALIDGHFYVAFYARDEDNAASPDAALIDGHAKLSHGTDY